MESSGDQQEYMDLFHFLGGPTVLFLPIYDFPNPPIFVEG